MSDLPPTTLFLSLEHLHVKPGKGSAFVRTKLKNYVTGGTMEKTFRGGAPVATADVFKTDTQFSYVDGDDYVFMDKVRRCRVLGWGVWPRAARADAVPPTPLVPSLPPCSKPTRRRASRKTTPGPST